MSQERVIPLLDDAPAGLGRPGRAGAAVSDDEIYDNIYTAIIERDLPPATKLTEDQLAEIFGVSRTRVRNVLQRLAHEGLITLRRNRGATVAQPTPKEARDVFNVRRIVETGMISRLGGQLSARSLASLRGIVAEERAANERRDKRRMIQLSSEFHLAMAELMGNPTLTGVLRELVSRSSLVVAVYERPGVSGCRCEDHARIIDRLADRDLAGAVTEMEAHIDAIENGLALDDSSDNPVSLRDVFARVAERRRS
ncbi:MAG: GntR family transcriptional regulator [Alphaproteobacteria bacterium]|jgi:DNA-binding GntR family transcriptional regulator|nr:GntR family transcriptional regulator [Alphaproteobacteria bacterium]